MDIIGRLGELGIIPVAKIENVEQATRLADALMRGGTTMCGDHLPHEVRCRINQ